MKKVISVRFKENGKSYYFDPGDAVIHTGEYVIVETARGVECGEVVQGVLELADAAVPKALKPITRMADSVDIRRMRQNREDEKRAYRTCQECIARHGLEMKLVEAEYTLDRSKIMFYFTADGRVDFRELVKDLAGIFHTRIELRQIGVRDESKMIGGLGICGQPFCCSRFLKDFQPVSIKMAKEQGLSLNPTKISGACGRLMCCLAYEESAKANAARMGEAVAAKSRFFCADAGQAATQLATEGLHPDIVMLDPPRKGCDEATLSAVVRMAPRRVVYVSCNPATAARDAAWLEQKGYHAEKVQPVDLFPRTKHCECVIVLSKGTDAASL